MEGEILSDYSSKIPSGTMSTFVWEAQYCQDTIVTFLLEPCLLFKIISEIENCKGLTVIYVSSYFSHLSTELSGKETSCVTLGAVPQHGIVTFQV